MRNYIILHSNGYNCVYRIKNLLCQFSSHIKKSLILKVLLQFCKMFGRVFRSYDNFDLIRRFLLLSMCENKTFSLQAEQVQSNPLIKYTLLFWLATNIVTDLKVENCANLTFIMVETKLETWIYT